MRTAHVDSAVGREKLRCVLDFHAGHYLRAGDGRPEPQTRSLGDRNRSLPSALAGEALLAGRLSRCTSAVRRPWRRVGALHDVQAPDTLLQNYSARARVLGTRSIVCPRFLLMPPIADLAVEGHRARDRVPTEACNDARGGAS